MGAGDNMSCVMGKHALQSWLLSYEKKHLHTGLANPSFDSPVHQSFFWYDTDYKI